MAKRIIIIKGDSSSQEVFKKVKTKIPQNSKVLVVLDSNHTREHVLKELNLFSSLVSRNSYIVVEDTIMPEVASYKQAKDYYKNDNAKQAVDIFLKNNKNFIADKAREKLGFTYFPGGFLKRIK
jgi:cephalosporin hydroxylase